MTVVLLTIVYTLISTVYSQPKDAICIWGRRRMLGRDANGLYRLGSEQANGAPYWKLDMTGTDCPNAYFWLYWWGDSNAGWYIGTSGTQDFAFRTDGLLHAKCTSGAPTELLDPTNCVSWAYLTDSKVTYFDTNDENVTASEGPCPTLNCASITVTGHSNSAGCIGTFDQTGTQSNHYTQTGGTGKIWWFNVPRFQWQCNTGTTNAEQTCDNTRVNNQIVQYVGVQEWQGETGAMTYTGAVCACYGGTVSMTFTCSAEAGSTTTYLPTSPNPTQVTDPTPRPTTITYVPTINPTAATDSPTAPTAPTAPTTITPPPTAPTEPTTQAPNTNTADTVYDPDDKGDNGSGGSMIDGLDDTWLWVIIIILIIILCCCCICCLWFYRKRQKENTNQYFGDQNDTGNHRDDQNL